MTLLASVNEVKAELGIADAETSVDARVQGYIEAASSEAEIDDGRNFEYQSYSNETYRGGGSTICLKNYPVDSGASFAAKDVNGSGTTTIFDASDYALDAARGIVRLKGGILWSDGPDAARFNYAAGYALSGTGSDTKVSVPAALNGAIIDYAVAMYRYKVGSITIEELDAIRDSCRAIWLKFKGHV